MGRARFVAVTLAVAAVLSSLVAAAPFDDAPSSRVSVVNATSSTVDVRLDRSRLAEVAPSRATVPVALRPGAYRLEVRRTPAEGDGVLATTTVTAPPEAVDLDIVVVAGVDGRHVLRVFRNEVGPTAARVADIDVRNAATTPRLDVAIAGVADGVLVAGGRKLVSVDPGTQQLAVTAGGRSVPLDLRVAAGNRYRIYAVGSPGDGSLDLVVFAAFVGEDPVLRVALAP